MAAENNGAGPGNFPNDYGVIDDGEDHSRYHWMTFEEFCSLEVESSLVTASLGTGIVSPVVSWDSLTPFSSIITSEFPYPIHFTFISKITNLLKVETSRSLFMTMSPFCGNAVFTWKRTMKTHRLLRPTSKPKHGLLTSVRSEPLTQPRFICASFGFTNHAMSRGAKSTITLLTSSSLAILCLSLMRPPSWVWLMLRSGMKKRMRSPTLMQIISAASISMWHPTAFRSATSSISLTVPG